MDEITLQSGWVLIQHTSDIQAMAASGGAALSALMAPGVMWRLAGMEGAIEDGPFHL